MLFSTPGGGRFSPAPPFVIVLPRPESPIISPDLESETCLKFSFENSLTPKRPVPKRVQAHILPCSTRLARHQRQPANILCQRRDLAIASCDARVVSRWFQESRR